MYDLKIKELEIDSFRGIKHEDLKLDSKSLVLLGENGTGKSSIANAIEYLLTSNVSLLKGSQDIDHNKAIRFFGKSDRKLNVKAVFSNGMTIERDETSFNCPAELKPLIKSLENGSNILNRKKLLKFIDSQPKERYTAIGKLFGYDYLDSVEDIFRKEYNGLEKSLSDKKQDYANSIKSFSDKLGLEFKLRYKNPSKKQKILNYRSSQKQYEKCLSELNERIDGKFPKLEYNTNFEDYLKDLQETLNSNNKKQAQIILDSIRSLEDPSKEGKLNRILSKYQYYYLNSAKNASMLLNLLDQSKQYILTNESTTCPVCKSDIDTLLITDNLNEEIGQLKTSLQSIEVLNEETYEFISYLEELNESYRFIEMQIESIEDDDISEILKCQRENIASLEKLIEDLELVISFNLNAAEIENPIESNETRIKNIGKYLEMNYFRQDKEYNDTLDLLNQCIILLISLKKTQEDIDSIEKEFKAAKTVYNTYKDEKVKYIRNTLENLTDKINEYYAFIHKDDGIINPRFEVSGSTGLKLKIDSFDEESDPREYSSEGHLDTLGLCIFLAFAKEYNPVPILVLDDIVATVDSSHKERISRLLLDEFDDHQLIITTHNKTWFNQIRHMRKARERKDNDYGKFQFIEITSWNIDEGPHLSNHKTDIQIIQKHLIRNDLVAAVHASRRLLENVLRNICLTNGSRLVLKESPYTLLEYLNAAENSIKYLTKGSELEEYYDDAFFEVEQVRYLGNSFVHGDDEDLTFNDASAFCDAVYELQKAVTCDRCGSYIKFNRYTHKGQCSNNKCQSSFDL